MTCAVLVTGGSGFLGQHVVGLLQTRAPHVAEIRVIDVVPYENKLDYEAPKPVKQYIGSITDEELVRRACDGVISVFHIASIVDVSMFPNIERMNHVNVTGTSVLLDVCRQCGVRRFLYCSSVMVMCGLEEIINGTEESTLPKKLVIHGYGDTKQKAESAVLNSNSSELRTIAIRPVAIYGEENKVTADFLKLAKRIGRWTHIDCKHADRQMVYAGNVAWMLVRAEAAMLNDDEDQIGGHAFIALDETPPGEIFEMRQVFITSCGIPISGFSIPLWIIYYLLCMVYLTLLLLSPIVKLNVSIGLPPVREMFFKYIFRNDKAKRMLSYTPLYSYKESLNRSVAYYYSCLQ